MKTEEKKPAAAEKSVSETKPAEEKEPPALGGSPEKRSSLAGPLKVPAAPSVRRLARELGVSSFDPSREPVPAGEYLREM